MNGATMPPIAPMTDAVLTPILRMMVGNSSALNKPMMVKEIVTADFATSVKPSLATHINVLLPLRWHYSVYRYTQGKAPV